MPGSSYIHYLDILQESILFGWCQQLLFKNKNKDVPNNLMVSGSKNEKKRKKKEGGREGKKGGREEGGKGGQKEGRMEGRKGIELPFTLKREILLENETHPSATRSISFQHMGHCFWTGSQLCAIHAVDKERFCFETSGWCHITKTNQPGGPRVSFVFGN